MSSTGDSVMFRRTRRLRELRSGDFPPEHYIHRGGALVQSFIDTGSQATVRRVLSLCGRPLYTLRSWAPAPRPGLSAPDEEIEASIVDPKHPLVRARYAVQERRSLAPDGEATAFAATVHAALPEFPLIGCDILKDHASGKLYVIEINAGGNTWHFSSATYAVQRAELGGRDAFVNQLGAWKIAAQALIAKTRELAR